MKKENLEAGKEAIEDKPLYPLNLQGFEDMLEDFTITHLKATGYSVGTEDDCNMTYDEKDRRVKAAYDIILNGANWQAKQATPVKRDEKTDRLIIALQTIVNWQFPETGKFWDKEQKEPMSYGAAYGSNGERDYMIRLAQEAITEYATNASIDKSNEAELK